MKINNLTWKVKFDDNMPENLFGQTNYSNLTIYLNPICCKENLRRTLLHEVMHAYCYSYGLTFTESFDRENFCEFISHNFMNIEKAYKEALKLIGEENKNEVLLLREKEC